MKLRTKLLIITLASMLGVQAQELTVKSMAAAPMDLSASLYRRFDLVGKPCALVKVQLATEGAKFEGNVMGQVEYKTGEYWVYMTEGSRELHIKHPNFLPLEIHFDEHGLKGLNSLTTYTLTIVMPSVQRQKIDFQARILCNGTDDRNESNQFKSGDDLYLSFLSPVSGYLAVYLLDASNQAYCLLPYMSQQNGIYAVKANQRYLFFNRTQAQQEEKNFVDEYVMTCENDLEKNTLYVIFSPNQFFKALDYASETNSNLPGTEGLPRELTANDFLKWLEETRKNDMGMNLKILPITITK